ncbi:MAG: hypothetical protein GX435_07255 [Exilispira sp.]|nr:hypothetical protein [Exilispira sp.]
MNILIYGFGAVGTVLSTCFKLSKGDNIYIYRKHKANHHEFVPQVEIATGIRQKVSLFSNPVKFWDKEKIDIAFITLKASTLPDSLLYLNENISKDTLVISLMNGMGWEDYFKDYNIYYGLIMYNAYKENDEKVHLASKGEILLDSRIEGMIKDKVCGLPFVFTDNISSYRYRKLWLNTLNGFLSLFNLSLYEIFNDKEKNKDGKILSLFGAFLKETEVLYELLSIKTDRFKSLDPQDLIELIDKIDKKLELDDRQKNMLVNFTRGKNSTLQSIEQKEKTEYRYIGGYLTKLADKVEFNYQLNRFVTDEIAYYDKTLSLRKIDEQTLNQFLK